MSARFIIFIILLSMWFRTDFVLASTDFINSSTITLERNVYVVTADGSNHLLSPGSYHLKAAPPWIRITPFGAQKTDRLLLESQELAHQEMVSAPVALSLQGDRSDSHHLILLLPNGKRFEALGTYTGIRSRAGFKPARIPAKRIAAKIRRPRTPPMTTSKLTNPVLVLQNQVATLKQELAALKSALIASKGYLTLRSTKDMQKSIGGRELTQVGRGQQSSIGDSQTTSIGKDQIVNIGRDRRETIGKNMSLTVRGRTNHASRSDYTLSSGERIMINAGKEITLKTGQASIIMKKNGDITIQGQNVIVKGSKDVVIKGSNKLRN